MKFGSMENRPYLQNKQSKRILDAARDVFVQEGGAAFSARRVAKAAKLSLGSVQHVFATTDALLTAMLEHVNEGYETAYREMAQRLPLSAEERLLAAIDYHLEGNCQADQRSFWFGLWSLSCHNEHAASLLKHAYRHHTRKVATFIGAARPTLGEQRCLDVATQVVAMLEGMMIFTGISSQRLSLKSSLIRNIRNSLLQIIFADDRADSLVPSAATSAAGAKRSSRTTRSGR